MLAGVRRKAMRICFGANDSWLVTPVVATERLRGQQQHNLGKEYKAVDFERVVDKVIFLVSP